MNTSSLIMLILFGLFNHSELFAKPQELAFHNVSLIPMDGTSQLIKEQVVIVKEGKISQIGHKNLINLSEDTRIVDGSGYFLMPGLVDMHVHWWDRSDNSALFLHEGVTTILSLGEFPGTNMIPLRTKSRRLDYLGPTIYTSGRRVESNREYTVEQIETLVEENYEQGFDLVKVHADVSPEAFDALHAKAKSLGIRVAGHAQREVGMAPAYRHQQDIVHAEEYMYGAFIPTGLLKIIVLFTLPTSLIMLLIFLFWKRIFSDRKHVASFSRNATKLLSRLKKTTFLFFLTSLIFLIILLLSIPPMFGIWAGKTPALVTTSLLSLCLLGIFGYSAKNIFHLWSESSILSTQRVKLSCVAIGMLFVSIISLASLPGLWRSSDSGLEDIAQETADAKIWITPNLVAYNSLGKNVRTERFHYPNSRYLTPAMRNYWFARSAIPPSLNFLSPLIKEAFDNQMIIMKKLIHKMHDKGVPMLAGTDAGIVGITPGLSINEELELLVNSGLSPYEALKTATYNPSIYLEEIPNFGSIKIGYTADLILLEKNPLDDIQNVEDKVGVMVKGNWLPKQMLEKKLELLAESRR